MYNREITKAPTKTKVLHLLCAASVVKSVSRCRGVKKLLLESSRFVTEDLKGFQGLKLTEEALVLLRSFNMLWVALQHPAVGFLS